MKKIILFQFIILILLTSCDEGRIYDEVTVVTSEGKSAIISANIINVASWPADYTVSVAAFEADNEFALVSKSVGIPSLDTGMYEISLTNIPNSAATLEICVVNRLRQRISSFYVKDLYNDEDLTLRIEDPLNANMFDVIQKQVFSTTCANCHGGSNFAAAHLYLTEGYSYENLIDVESQVLGDGEMRVVRGSRNSSLLYKILTGEISSTWNYDHSAEITDYNTLELIGAWIDNGAIN